MSAPAPSRTRSFVKMHGLRNHFVIVDARGEAYRPAIDEIVRICDPQVGVGADQLIVIEAADSESAGDVAAFMRIYNTDGREAEACGNATRCVAWLLLEESRRDDLVVETRAGRLRCERAGQQRVRSGMGQIRRDWQSIPLSQARDTLHLDVGSGQLGDAVACNVGNPHAVFFVEDVDAVDLSAFAPAIQADPLFPEQVNVGVAELVSPEHLKLKVYERGAGLTMACGSGACAAAYAARARGLSGAASITVTLPGGDLEIGIDSADSATQTGPVEFSFRGEYRSDEAG